MSQWEPTDPFEVDGLWFQVVPEGEATSPKRKNPDHRVLQFWRPGSTYPHGRWERPKWLDVTMSQGFVMADFFFQEEDFLYPPPRFQGGWKYLGGCVGAARRGWREAHKWLREEVETKAAMKDQGEERVLQALRDIDEIQRRYPDAPWLREPGLGAKLTRERKQG